MARQNKRPAPTGMGHRPEIKRHGHYLTDLRAEAKSLREAATLIVSALAARGWPDNPALVGLAHRLLDLAHELAMLAEGARHG